MSKVTGDSHIWNFVSVHFGLAAFFGVFTTNKIYSSILEKKIFFAPVHQTIRQRSSMCHVYF